MKEGNLSYCELSAKINYSWLGHSERKLTLQTIPGNAGRPSSSSYFEFATLHSIPRAWIGILSNGRSMSELMPALMAGKRGFAHFRVKE